MGACCRTLQTTQYQDTHSKAVAQDFQADPERKMTSALPHSKSSRFDRSRLLSREASRFGAAAGSPAKTRRFSKKLSCRFGIRPETVGSFRAPILKTRCAGEPPQAHPEFGCRIPAKLHLKPTRQSKLPARREPVDGFAGAEIHSQENGSAL